MQPALLALEELSVRLGDTWAVRGVSLELREGELGCLVGPSGCGKTSILRAIAGLEPAASGRVRIGGRDQAGLPPERRPVGLVFQDLALFPHRTVAGNLDFALHGLPRAERRERIRELLALTGLGDLSQRYPHELSGGQQQRVAVARTLARRPALLLLDEPFAALDAPLRRRLREELAATCRRLGITALLVTHDREEGFAFADRLGVMREGRLEQWDAPYELYHRPANPFVAEFVGEGRWLPGRIGDDGTVECPLGRFPPTLRLAPGTAVRLLVRPDDVLHDPASPLLATVRDAAFRGAGMLYELELADGGRIAALFPSHRRLQPGERTGIRPDLAHVIAFPEEAFA